MPRAATSAEALSKLSTAMEALKNEYSYKEYRKWDCREYPKRFAISTTFSTVLRQLGAIESNPQERGEIRLTERMVTLRASTLRKYINEYSAESQKKSYSSRKRIKVPVNKEDLSFKTVLVALKKQVREEVISELLKSLVKS